MPDFADDTSSELERKAKALKFMALFETVTYLLLFYFWIVAPNDAVKAVVGFFHGLVWMAFVAMTVIIRARHRVDLGLHRAGGAHRPDRRASGVVAAAATPRELLVPHASPPADR